MSSTEESRMSHPDHVDHQHQGGDKLDKLSEYSASRDSGFLSGPCTTESDLSSQVSNFDLMSSSTSSGTSSYPHHPTHPHHKPSASISSITTCKSSKSSGYSRLDSGVDVSVSESLSGLNISEHGEESSECQMDHPEGKKSYPEEPQQMPPWEYFFSPDEDGDTQLHIAIMEKNEAFVNNLISLVPHPSILDFQNDLCQTALHVAVLCGQPRIVRRLVAAGARVDMRDRKGNTPLHLAANNGDVAAVQGLSIALSAAELQECGLRYQAFAQPLPQQLDLTNYDGQGPIHLAAVGGHCDVIRALHWLGTHINAKEGKGGRTALHYTVERGHRGALRVLISECGADLEVENYAGLTPYQLAVGDNPSSLLAKELLQSGAIPHSVPMDDDESSSDEEEYDNVNINNDHDGQRNSFAIP